MWLGAARPNRGFFCLGFFQSKVKSRKNETHLKWPRQSSNHHRSWEKSQRSTTDLKKNQFTSARASIARPVGPQAQPSAVHAPACWFRGCLPGSFDCLYNSKPEPCLYVALGFPGQTAGLPRHGGRQNGASSK